MVSSEGHSVAVAANFVFHSFSPGGGGGRREGGTRTPGGRSRLPLPGLLGGRPLARPSRFLRRAWGGRGVRPEAWLAARVGVRVSEGRPGGGRPRAGSTL